MNKNDLIDALAPRLGGRAAAALAVESLVDVVMRQIAAGDSVGVTGFGTFEPVDRAPRTGRNPHTGEAVPIPATRTPRFRPGAYFKAVVADPAGLPPTGLAGARVGSDEQESPAPGAPATIRRPKASRGGRRADPVPADPTTVAADDVPAPRPARAGRRTGTPETVRAAGRTEPAPAPTAEPSRGAAAGRLSIGGEQITRDMITAKKAQLARAKNDPVTPEGGPRKKGKKKNKDKRDTKQKKGKKAARQQDSA